MRRRIGDDPAHPASAIDEVAFVDGSVASEGSFLPGVIEHAERWRKQYDVVGIYAVGETLVEPTGLVADYFGLPFPGLRASRACRNKYLQRWYLPDLSPVSVLIPPGARDVRRRTGPSGSLPWSSRPRGTRARVSRWCTTAPSWPRNWTTIRRRRPSSWSR